MTASDLLEALRDVHDPCCADRGISIVDMGVGEDVRRDGSHVEVDLVPTTGWCPFVATMSSAIPDRLRALDGVESGDGRAGWGPGWTPARPAPWARGRGGGPRAGPAARAWRGARGARSMPLERLQPYRERRLAHDRGAA